MHVGCLQYRIDENTEQNSGRQTFDLSLLNEVNMSTIVYFPIEK